MSSIPSSPVHARRGGQGVSVSFIQKAVASTATVRRPMLNNDVKITSFIGGDEQRMNGACVGGTSVFIDQKAALLTTNVDI
jgi:hypothetical protein